MSAEQRGRGRGRRYYMGSPNHAAAFGVQVSVTEGDRLPAGMEKLYPTAIILLIQFIYNNKLITKYLINYEN